MSIESVRANLVAAYKRRVNNNQHQSFLKNTGYVDIDRFRRGLKRIQVPLLVGAQGVCVVLIILVAPLWAILSIWVMLFMRISGKISKKIDEIDRYIDGRF